MKKNKRIVYTFSFLLLLGLIWFKLDKDLYFLGKSYFRYNSALPFNIHPYYRYNFEGGFALNDYGGMSIVSASTVFENKSGKVDTISRIIQYGIEKEKLIVEIETENKSIYYLEIVKDVSNNMCGNCFSIGMIDKKSIPISGWYKIPSDALPISEVVRNLVSILIFIGFIFLLVNVSKVLLSNKRGLQG